MHELQRVLSAYPRIHAVCRPRRVRDDEGVGSVTEHQARLLAHLDEDDPAMVTELAEYLGVTPSTMSLNLKRLQSGGFIERVRDPQDRRVMNVRLTPAGARVRDAARMLDPERVDALLQLLRPDERRRAVDGLVKLADAANALAGRGHEVVEGLTGMEPS